MSKVSNVLTMLELLGGEKKYSIKELSERLEVTPRMIRIYKDELEKVGIYIDTIRGPYGGYVLHQHVWLPHRSFSKYDLQLMENIYHLIKDNPRFMLNKEYLNLIDKVKGVYQSTKQKTSQSAINQSADEKKKYNTLNRAIKERRKIFISFLSADGSISERVIHPCDMFYYGDSTYVSAFCELRREIRHFRLERILAYNLLDEKY